MDRTLVEMERKEITVITFDAMLIENICKDKNRRQAKPEKKARRVNCHDTDSLCEWTGASIRKQGWLGY